MSFQIDLGNLTKNDTTFSQLDFSYCSKLSHTYQSICTLEKNWNILKSDASLNQEGSKLYKKQQKQVIKQIENSITKYRVISRKQRYSITYSYHHHYYHQYSQKDIYEGSVADKELLKDLNMVQQQTCLNKKKKLFLPINKIVHVDTYLSEQVNQSTKNIVQTFKNNGKLYGSNSQRQSFIQSDQSIVHGHKKSLIIQHDSSIIQPNNKSNLQSNKQSFIEFNKSQIAQYSKKLPVGYLNKSIVHHNNKSILTQNNKSTLSQNNRSILSQTSKLATEKNKQYILESSKKSILQPSKKSILELSKKSILESSKKSIVNQNQSKELITDRDMNQSINQNKNQNGDQNKKQSMNQNKSTLGQSNQVINKNLLKQNINIKKSQFSQFLDKENRQKGIKPMNALINYKRNMKQKGMENNNEKDKTSNQSKQQNGIQRIL